MADAKSEEQARKPRKEPKRGILVVSHERGGKMVSEKGVWLEKHGRLHAVAPCYIFFQV